jgi:cold shock CspA family protein
MSEQTRTVFRTSTEQRETGFIAGWNPHDAFGFISRDRAPRGRQVFIHMSELPDGVSVPVPVGTRCSFIAVTSAKGLRATAVEFPRDARAERTQRSHPC